MVSFESALLTTVNLIVSSLSNVVPLIVLLITRLPISGCDFSSTIEIVESLTETSVLDSIPVTLIVPVLLIVNVTGAAIS